MRIVLKNMSLGFQIGMFGVEVIRDVQFGVEVIRDVHLH